VGSQIQPGTYSTQGPTTQDDGQWARLSNTTGDPTAVITHGIVNGPTTVTKSLAINESRKAVAIFSMEMSASQLAFRLISSLGRINQQHLRTGDIQEEEWPRVTSAITLLSDYNSRRAAELTDSIAEPQLADIGRARTVLQTQWLALQDEPALPGGLREDAKFGSWLFGIAHNLSGTWLRRRPAYR
jgi:hypothetical protein